MLASGFTTDMQGVVMSRPNEAGLQPTGCIPHRRLALIRDWVQGWDVPNRVSLFSSGGLQTVSYFF